MVQGSWFKVHGKRLAVVMAISLIWLLLPQTAQAAAPVADDQTLITNEDTAINITLTATDADGDTLTYAIVTSPSHGSLTGTAPNLTYKPYSNYNGADSFTFKANDGTSDSNIATISLSINPVNDAPIVSSIPAPITFAINPEETSVTKTYIIPVTDIENDPLTYSVVGLPLGASFNTQTGEITWTFTHQDIASYPNITFTASDGQLQSSKTVTIVLREAITYCLDEVNGDDSNGGTNETPWKTLAKARATLQAGDTVKLRNGNYGEFRIVSPFTSPTDWITYEAETGHTPIITKLYIRFPSSLKDIYHKFNNITFQEPNLGYDPKDPPSWVETIPFRIEGVNYVHLHNCKLYGYNKYLTAIACYIIASANVVIEHCDIKTAQSGLYVSTYGADPNVKILYNQIHDISGGTMVEILGGGRTVNSLLIEGNHINDMHKDQYDPYFPNETIWCDPAVFPQGSPPALIPGEELWIYCDTEQFPNYTAKAIVKCVAWDTADTPDCYNVYIYSLSGYAAYPPLGSICTGQTSGVEFAKFGHDEGIHTGSAVGVRSPHWVFRNNIVHDIYGSGMAFKSGYAAGFFSDIVIENNLFYDVRSGNIGLQNLSTPIVFRNNTNIGSQYSNSLHVNEIADRYFNAGGFPNWTVGFDGTGIYFYNNVFVGQYPLPSPTDPNKNNYLEDNNIYWSAPYDVNTTKGANSLVAYWVEPVSGPDHPRGLPNYFEFIGYGSQDAYNGKTGTNVTGSSQSPPYDYDYSVDGVTPFFAEASFLFNPITGSQFGGDRGKTFSFKLISGSPGINFGAATVKTWQEVLAGYTGPSQPPDSLGSIGPDGFIRDDGQSRDATHHSAGCYEYVPRESFLFGDVNADGEISAYDAALAAHIAVDLEHPDIKNRAAADVNGDSEVSAYDAALIAQRAVGLIDKFPVE